MRLTILNPLQFSNQIYKSLQFFHQIKSNQMLVFEERGKPEYPEKNLSEQSREPTNSAHIWRRGNFPFRKQAMPFLRHLENFSTGRESLSC